MDHCVIRAIGDLQVQRSDDALDNLPGERQILLGWAAHHARQLRNRKHKLGPELCYVVESAGDLLIQITQTLVTILFKSLHSLSGATTLLNNDVMTVCLPGIYDDCTQAMSSVICCFVGQCIRFHTKIGNMRSYKSSNELHGIA